jgi:dTDP-4-dehydrorhamnose 3,5-epimerase
VRTEPTALAGVVRLTDAGHQDERGLFREIYREERYRQAGVVCRFVQDNISVSVRQGTVRGLHFQLPPMSQDKLVVPLSGTILDVVVDVRAGSPTFGRHVAVELDAGRGEQLFVPAGFAHGFCTLAPSAVVLYKVSRPYSPAHDRGVNWADPQLGIDWPVAPGRACLSPKDRDLPPLSAVAAFLAAVPAPPESAAR